MGNVMAGVTVMSSTPNAIVVWEFAENGRWIPYDPTVTNVIERYYANLVSNQTASPVNDTRLPPMTRALRSHAASTSAILELKLIDPSLDDCYIDFSRNEQIRKNPGGYGPTSVQIQRSVYPEDCLLGKGILWQWEAGDKYKPRWIAYDMETALIVEEQCRQGAANVHLLSNNSPMPYFIDFKQMKQNNLWTGFERNIQRHIVQQPYPRVMVREDIIKRKPCSTVAVGPSSLTSTQHKNQPSNGPQRNSIIGPSASSAQTCSSTKQSASSSNSLGAVGGKRKHAKRGAAPYPMSPVKQSSGAPQDMQQPPHGIEQTTRNDCDIHKILMKYSNVVDEVPPDEQCCICCEKLSAPSGYTETPLSAAVIELKKCTHKFHRACLCAMYKTGVKDCSMQCPICKTIYGLKMGCCPEGQMRVQTMGPSLPGYKCPTIVIEYNFRPGRQDERHPNPGQPYYTKGFPRQCFLPEDKDGNKVLGLLKKAWERKLTFTIGTSVTTGHPDTVVWNEIHHKTEFGSNVTGHGYPDPNYIDNVLSELAAQGITEDSSDEDSEPAHAVAHV